MTIKQQRRILHSYYTSLCKKEYIDMSDKEFQKYISLSVLFNTENNTLMDQEDEQTEHIFNTMTILN